MIKVLITDDNKKRTDLLLSAISDADFGHLVKVTVCLSSDAARVELFGGFDILILDVLLPKKINTIPQASNSICLLKDICDSGSKYVRPKIIVGLTADISSIGVYQEEFIQYATVVLSGGAGSSNWLATLLTTIDGYVSGERRLASEKKDTVLISIHGIRTYGHWQERLGRGVKSYSRNFECVDMKYGFFDLISFSIPFLRDRKADLIASRLISVLKTHQHMDIHIVSHSFGSYILSQAMKVYVQKKINTVILCGSPLRHSDDIDHIVCNSNLTINECGTRDLILILARTTLLGLGDAGRVGFTREQTASFMNRYYSGGHSLYFDDASPSFSERHWLPVIATDSVPEKVDMRSNFLGEDLIDVTIKFLTIVKPMLYVCFASFLVVSFFVK